MARVHLPITVLDPDGVPVNGASVTVRRRSDNSLVNLYAAETGGSAVANPASTDSTGRVDRWMERQAVKMTVTATGMTTYDEYWDGVPAGDGTIDTAYVANSSITKAKLATDALNGYLKLAVAADLVAKFGHNTTGGWAGANFNEGTITHGLGRTPLYVIGAAEKINTSTPGVSAVVFSPSTFTSTTFAFRVQTADEAVTSAVCNFWWLAVG